MTLEFTSDVSTATITLVESTYQKQERERVAAEEAERQRIARLPKPAPKPAPRAVSYGKTPIGRVGVYYKKAHPEAWDCVNYLRKTGVYVPSGAWAYRIRVNTRTPAVGRVIVTYEGPIGHFGVVIGLSNGLVHIRDGNYDYGYETHRTLPANSRLIKGYL